MDLLKTELKPIRFTRLSVGTTFSNGRYYSKNHLGQNYGTETLFKKITKSKGEIIETTLPARHVGGVQHFAPFRTVFIPK